MERLHEKAIQGIASFNERDFFEAHELLEEAWLAETSDLRNLYRGVLQAAVVYLHITRNNYEGAVKVYGRSQKWLRGWPPVVRGLDVASLNDTLDAAIAEVQRLGPGNLADFPETLFASLHLEQRTDK